MSNKSNSVRVGVITMCLACSKHSTTINCYYHYYFTNEKAESQLKFAHRESRGAGIDSKAHVLPSYPFGEYLLSTYCVPDIELSFEDALVK